MRKFTVFSLMLTIIAVVVAAEIFVNDYLPDLKIGSSNNDIEDYNLPSTLDASATGSANVLGVGGMDTTGATTTTDSAIYDPSTASVPAGTFDPNALNGFVNENEDILTNSNTSGIADPEAITVPSTETPSTVAPTSSDVSFDIEDFSNSYDHAKTNVYLTNEHVTNAGFTGAYLEPEDFDGFLFKTISIGDLYGLKVDKYSITDGKTNYAKVYVIVPEDISTVGEIYSVLKVRAASGLETDTNETNQFGDASFFMNDMRRQQIAFLTARIGSFIYCFSYQKEYHPQMKNLVELLK